MTNRERTVSVELALAQCEAALSAAGLQLLARESQELFELSEDFGQLRERVEEGGTIHGGLSSFAGRLAGLVQHASRQGQLALLASGRADAQPDTLN